MKAWDTFLEWLPIQPFSFDMVFSQGTFAPDNRAIGVLGGITALRYGNQEVRTIYRYYSSHTHVHDCVICKETTATGLCRCQ